MFEQSILTGESAGNKTRALAASFGAQGLLIGIAILIPLIFSDHLPRIQLWTPLSAPLHQQPEPVPVESSSTPAASTSILHTARIFHPPAESSHANGPAAATILNDGELSASGYDPANFGVPAGLTAALPTIHATAPQKTPIVPAVAPKPVDKPHLIGGDVLAAKLIRKIVPEYPPLAKQARISGKVRLTGVIAKDGTIEQLEVLSGNPLLVPAALAAVKRWLYQPTFLNGQPVEVIAPIDVIFTLSQ
jgi:protein TonB